MHKRNDATPFQPVFDHINDIPWFSNCGNAVTADIPFPFRQVGSWAEAREIVSGAGCEETRLAARNALTEFLSKRFSGEYAEWNRIARPVRDAFVEPLAAKVLAPLAQQQQLGQAFVERVQWDRHAAVMEYAFGTCPGRPVFLLSLLHVYEAGHCPCGWEGSWSDGKLILY